ncbi:MAG: aromatic ring-hydroxylating oxygenase subunit alpha [Alphaproteobacteria bacterium]
MSTVRAVTILEDGAAAPTGTATITAERFTSPDYMHREWEKLWPRCWLFAGVTQDVSEPGDYFVFDLGPESIIVSCAEDGTVAANYNSCQHRGARIAVNERGAVDAFVCPYHGWQYELDGTLKHVPEADRFVQGTPCDRLSLKPVRVEVWAGTVWVCMDDDVPPLRDFLDPMIPMIEPFRMEDMVLAVDQTVSLDCNWKAVMDNFGELYHVEHIHPQHETIFDCPAARTELWAGGHNRVLIEGFTVNTRLPIPEEVPFSQHLQMKAVGMDPEDYRGRVLDVRRDIQVRKREKGPELGFNYDALTDEQLSDIVQYNIFPNIVMAIQPEEVWIMRSRPHATDPNKCYWDKFTLRMLPNPDADWNANISFNLSDKPIAAEGMERPEHENFTQEEVIAGKYSMTITVDQDVHLIRDVQKGMHSRGFSEAWLNQDEGRVQHYHDWIDTYMAG